MFRTFLESRGRWLVFLVCVLGVLAVVRSGTSADRESAAASLAESVASKGLWTSAEDIAWLAPDPGPLGFRPAMMIAAREDEHTDVYYIEARLANGTQVLELAWLNNLTSTSSASEDQLVQDGDFVGYTSQVEGEYDALTILDLRGEPAELTQTWSARARAQNAISNLQSEGRLRGFGRRRYSLRTRTAGLSLTTEQGLFVARSAGNEIRLDPYRIEPVTGADLVETRTERKGEPGTISWVVDTVRNLSFVGPEPITWLQHRVYGIRDAFERAFYRVVGTDDAKLADDIAAELGLDERRRHELAVEDPETGLPPARLQPILEPALRGEGEWVRVENDPFVRQNPNAPPAFYRSFLRADGERDWTRVYMILWDPRQVQLRIMSGTTEPESATGQTAPGMAPREREVLERFVGGFNGGFQALHGEFGMMSEGDVYLPPKPWAATVGILKDGRVAMGSWLPPPEGERYFQESWAIAQIPDELVDFRQNLTSVVEDGVYNPWERWYWGAAPVHAGDQTYIHRSALCVTGAHFVIYFWGERMGPEALGRVMNAAGCRRSVHLDINHPHTGFEFYNVQPRNQPFEPLAEALDPEWQFEGPVPEAPNYHMRARKGISSMRTMNFPRYIGTDPRDFFYLLLKPVLPGRALSDGTEFETSGLPHAGWPHALARASRGTDERRTWWIRIDPSRAVPQPVAEPDMRRPLAYLTAADQGSGPWALYARRPDGDVQWRYHVGPLPADDLDPRLVLRGNPANAESTAALGVDSSGFLVYVERPASDPVSMTDRLGAAGITEAIDLANSVRLALAMDADTSVGPDGYERTMHNGLAFVADERAPTEILFPEVQPAPYRTWARLQDSRVRYRRDPDRPFRFGSGGQQ